LLHRCRNDGYWLDAFELSQHAIEIASRPEISCENTIRQLLDIAEDGPVLVAIWEWADLSLEDFIREPDADPAAVADSVEANVSAALRVLHNVGIVHMDVTPNNILRVGETWKLADLDSCVRRGEPAGRRPLAERYLHPELRGASPPARDEFDAHGLEQVLAGLRSHLVRLRFLAARHLGEYPPGEAMDALCDVQNTTPATLPDNLLVEAARRCLEQMDTMEFPGYSRVLRQVLFEHDLPGEDR
jgi:serine/threonine protein kinase